MKRRILISGICGRMGSKVAELILADPELLLVAGVERPEHPAAGGTLAVGGASVKVVAGFSTDVPPAELLVDFTSPQGATEALAFCLERGIPLVTGTTGLSEDILNSLRAASGKIPVLLSANMSRGVTLIDRMLPEVRRMAGRECDVEIVEKHHRAKKDSPSGTAIRLAQTLTESSGSGAGKVVIHSVRAGDVVGEHTIVFGLKGERIEIKHIAESRDCFAHGTIACVKFLLDKPAGWYTMNDVLGAPPLPQTNNQQ